MEKGKPIGRQGPPSCRQAGRPFSASRPPLSLGTWFPSFPFSSFASYLPDLLLVPPSSSPRVCHFCLYFVVIVDRKRTSALWKMAAVALPVRERSPSSLPVIPPRNSLCPEFYYWRSRPKRNAFRPTNPHGAFYLSALYHCPVRLWPSTRVRTVTVWCNALHMFLTSCKPSVLS